MVDQRELKRIDERSSKVSNVLVVGSYRTVVVLKIAAEQLLISQMEFTFSTSIFSVPSLQPSNA
jgi:hypothetical protein